MHHQFHTKWKFEGLWMRRHCQITQHYSSCEAYTKPLLMNSCCLIFSRTRASQPSCVTFSTWCWTIPPSTAESVPEWSCWNEKSRTCTRSSQECVIGWEHLKHLQLVWPEGSCFSSFRAAWPNICVALAGPGVPRRRLQGDWYRTQQPSLCRGQTSASARGEISSTQTAEGRCAVRTTHTKWQYVEM